MRQLGWPNPDTVLQQLPVALLHTLWQGALIALLLWLLLRRLPAARCELRYVFCLASLLSVVLVWFGTLGWLSLEYSTENLAVSGEAVPRAVEAIPAPAAGSVENSVTLAVQQRATIPWGRMALWLWGWGVAAMFGRTVWMLRGAGRLRRHAVPCVEPAVLEALAGLRATLGVRRRVSLLVSAKVAGPVVLGVMAPAILLPQALLGVPPDHLQAILAHELAHIRRHDYLVNIFQLLVESLLFFNPAVWWISRQMRVEREACCDALAAGNTQTPVQYVEALASLAAQLRPRAELAMAPPPQGLLDRARRVLLPQDRPVVRLPWRTLLMLAVVAVALLGLAGGGTFLAVAGIAQAMRPEERVARLKEAQEPLALLPHYEEDAPKAKISGTVAMHDGRPLPDKVEISAYVTSGSRNHSRGTHYGYDLRDNRFEMKVVPGLLVVYTKTNGYQHDVYGPVLVEPGSALEGIQLILGPERFAHVHISDEFGTIIPQARVDWRVPLETGGGGRTFLWDGSVTGDVNGIARIPHVWDKTTEISVVAAGYQRLPFTPLQLRQDEGRELRLQPSEPVVLQLRDETSREPVAGAVIRLLQIRGRVNEGFGLDDMDREILATSDASGRAVLDTLMDQTRYWCTLNAPNGARQVLEVHAGDPPREVLLGRPLMVSGTIDGQAWPGLEEYVLEYAFSYTLDNYTTTIHGREKVALQDGLGQFSLPLWLPGTVHLHGGPEPMKLRVEHPVDNVVLVLPPEREEFAAVEEAKRKVLLEIQPGEGPPVEGTLWLSYIDQSNQQALAEFLVIRNGRVEVELDPPGRLRYRPGEMSAHWIPEGEVEVPLGTDPLVAQITAHPAGAIHGRIIGADAERVGVSVKTLERAPIVEKMWQDYASRTDGSGGFFCGPLPLEGTYRIWAQRHASAVLSAPIEVTAAAPIHELQLEIPPGLPVSGQLLLPDGSGFPGHKIHLNLETEALGSHVVEQVTGADGAFTFEGLNPDLEVRYALDVNPRSGYTAIRREVRPGDRVTLQLETGRVLQGRVVQEPDGAPVAGVEVYAHTTGDLPVHIVDADDSTDAEGRFRFSTLREAVYSLGVRNARLVAPVQTGPDTETEVVLRVEDRSSGE